MPQRWEFRLIFKFIFTLVQAKKKKKGLLSSHNLLHVLSKGGGIVTPGTYMAFV